MSNQGDGVAGTQILSQSIYESIIQKGKSVYNAHELLHQDSAETQRTKEEGEEGHVDITSSFVTHHGERSNLEDSESVALSPSQSHLPLTQFPESQRFHFRTPATTGKRREYNGETAESAVLPRNPFARGADTTPGKMMGLSQAFAGTQAISSPFSNGLPTVLRSDRPSPNVDLQGRPDNAISSPLRPITEPAARYVPMRQSQAKRDRIDNPGDVDSDGGDSDEFAEEPSMVRRHRVAKERGERVMQQLRGVSSPVLVTGSDRQGLSPQMQPPSSPRAGTAPANAVADTAAPVFLSMTPSSEAETDLEDEAVVDVRQSSQANLGDEEDKENTTTVPETIGPFPRVIEQPMSQMQASPSLRRGITANADTQSSEPVRIMNSQPSQRPSKRQKLSGPFSTSSRDDVGTSLNALNAVSTVRYEQGSSRHKAKGGASSSAPVTRLPKVGEDAISYPLSSEIDTVAETASHLRRGQSQPLSIDDPKLPDPVAGRGSSDYETAYNQLPSIRTAQTASQASSQPIPTTPPGRRRSKRRMDLISWEQPASPNLSSTSFSAAQALQLHAEEITSEITRISPMYRSTAPPRSRERHEYRQRIDQNESRSALAEINKVEGTEALRRTMITPKPRASNLATINSVTKDVGEPADEHLFQSSNQAASTDISKRPISSLWDPESSPERPRSTLRRRMKLLEACTSAPSPDTHKYVAGRSAMSPDASNFARPRAKIESDEASGNFLAPNMVFACFNGKTRAYFPALYLGVSTTDPEKYIVQWEGYAPDEVDKFGVKALDIRVNDCVKINMEGLPKVPHVVRGFKNKLTASSDQITDVHGYHTLTVTPKPRRGQSVKTTNTPLIDVPVKSIYLDNNLWSQMKDRDFRFTPATEQILPVERDMSIERRVPSMSLTADTRLSSPTGSNLAPKAGGIFSHMAFAVSYEDTERKNWLVELVEFHGGLVLTGSFADLLCADSTKLKPEFTALGFTALLTERHSRKEKYMQALALGLPCLSGRWIEACVACKATIDWRLYLLPAGESSALDGATRSRILPTLDSQTSKLSDMITARPCLLRCDAAILITGKGKSEAKRAPYIFLIRALGAVRVDKAIDINHAKSLMESGSSCVYRYLFVDDRDVESTRALLEPHKTQKDDNENLPDNSPVTEKDNRANKLSIQGIEFIVQSLILGHLYHH